MASHTIDIHPHVIANDLQRYPLAPLGGHQSDWSRQRPVTVEAMIAAMDKAGVDKSALVQASTCYGHDNSYVADAVATFPDRFTGVFSVDVLSPDAPAKMRFWRSRGLTGLRLFTFGSTLDRQADWIDDPRTFPAWETATALQLPICMQMSQAGLPQLVGMVKRFPEVKVVLDHFARPALADGPPYAAAASLFALAQYPNIFLKATPRVFEESRNGKATPESFFRKIVAEFGAARIAWGSNYPASEGPLSQLLALARQSVAALPAADHAWIFAKTAQSLYPAFADA
jgi:L-fuconolactonase